MVPAHLSFEGVSFEGVSFIEGVSFEGVSFIEGVSFEGVSFIGLNSVISYVSVGISEAYRSKACQLA